MPKPENIHCSLVGDYSNESPRLRFADGGRLLKLSFARSPSAEWNDEMFGSRGGVRGKCKGFSFGSRRRMLERLNSVSVGAALPYFVTATLPDEMFNDDAAEFAKSAKGWLDSFFKRLRRAAPKAAGFWRIEWQARKSGRYEGKLFPHFHLLVWGLRERLLGVLPVKERGEIVGTREVWEAFVETPDNQLSFDLVTAFAKPTGSPEAELQPGEVSCKISACGGLPALEFQGKSRFVKRCENLVSLIHLAPWDAKCADRVRNMGFQDWASLAWYHVVASGNVDHLSAGVRVERVRSWGGVMCYCAKYMAKADCEFLSDVAFGRSWGIVNRACVPWAKMVEIDLDGEVGVRLRRVAVRYLEKRIGRKRHCPYGVTLFCDVAQFRKLWERPPPDPF
jgi:hypothetical protein